MPRSPTKRLKYTPVTNLLEVRSKDVVYLGRGGKKHKHTGNVRFQALINEYQEEWGECKTNEGRDAVVGRVLPKLSGMRFLLQYDKKAKQPMELTRESVDVKTRQHLREAVMKAADKADAYHLASLSTTPISSKGAVMITPDGSIPTAASPDEVITLSIGGGAFHHTENDTSETSGLFASSPSGPGGFSSSDIFHDPGIDHVRAVLHHQAPTITDHSITPTQQAHHYAHYIEDNLSPLGESILVSERRYSLNHGSNKCSPQPPSRQRDDAYSRAHGSSMGSPFTTRSEESPPPSVRCAQYTGGIAQRWIDYTPIGAETSAATIIPTGFLSDTMSATDSTSTLSHSRFATNVVVSRASEINASTNEDQALMSIRSPHALSNNDLIASSNEEVLAVYKHFSLGPSSLDSSPVASLGTLSDGELDIASR